MKLYIKEKYFKQIKEGTKKIEYRDAHITFICEETGEKLRKEVEAVDLIENPGSYPDVCEDDFLIQFVLMDDKE